MKYAVLLLAVLVGVPILARKMADNVIVRRFVMALLAFNIFNPAHINLYSDETYRGESRGFEVTTVDLLVLALFLCLRMRRRPSGGPHRFAFVRYAYLATVLLSFTATPSVLRSAFSLWKLTRMFFTFGTFASAFLEIDMVSAALTGLAFGVLSEGLLALQQKYVHHMVRVAGTQSHPNTLAMLVNLISPVAFALLMSGRGRKITVYVFAISAVCDVISLSRGGMMMFALAAILGSLGAFLRGANARKVKIVVFMFLGAVAVLLKSIDTIIKRFTEAPKESELARKLFNAAARQMAGEHTFGVGLNMYSYVLEHGGYAARLGIEPGDRNGIAHHIYWLTAAETGYVGLAAYLLMLGTIYVSGIRAATGRGVRGDIALGIVVGLTTMYLQGTAEWIARQTNMSYCFWMFAAMISAFRVHQTRRA